MTQAQLESIESLNPANRSQRLRALDNCLACPVRSTSICSTLDRHELALFAGISRQITYRAQQTLFMEGLKVDATFNITSGLVRLYRLLPNGRRQLVGFAFPGDFVGLSSEELYGFSADAAVATTVCCFPRDAFLAFLRSHHKLLHRIYEATARDLERTRDQLLLLGPRRADSKIAAFLLAMRQRQVSPHGSSALVSLPMGRQDIGDYLGLSIATVSRTLHRLARRGLILIVPKGVRLMDLQRLEHLATA